MKRSKYDETIPVSWRDVLRCLEWALVVRRYEAERWLDAVQVDIEHNYPDDLQKALQRALGACERVFYHFELISSLRRYLRYKPKTAERLGVQRCYDFYAQYKKGSPGSASLEARTTEGRSTSE